MWGQILLSSCLVKPENVPVSLIKFPQVYMSNITVSLRPGFGFSARSEEFILNLQHRETNLAELHTASQQGTKETENYKNDLIYPAMNRNVLFCKNFFSGCFY